jgi:TM2 domain-containing membrane protein YozV
MGCNRYVYALLAGWFGLFGLHKFYLGRTTEGIKYLIFWWTFIPWIYAGIDAIKVLFMSDEEFRKKYCKK